MFLLAVNAAATQHLPETKSYSYSSYQANNQPPEVFYEEHYHPQLEVLDYDDIDSEFAVEEPAMVAQISPMAPSYSNRMAVLDSNRMAVLDYNDEEDFEPIDMEFAVEEPPMTGGYADLLAARDAEDEAFLLDSSLALEDLRMYPEDNAQELEDMYAPAYGNVFEELLIAEQSGEAPAKKSAIMLGTDWNDANFMKSKEILAGQRNEIDLLIAGLAGTKGYVNAWINLNQDGEFQEDEMITKDVLVAPMESLNMARFDRLGGVFGTRPKMVFDLPAALPTGMYNLMIELNDMPNGMGEILDEVVLDIAIVTQADFLELAESDQGIKAELAARHVPGFFDSIASYFESNPENLRAPLLLESNWTKTQSLPTSMPVEIGQWAAPEEKVEPIASKTALLTKADAGHEAQAATAADAGGYWRWIVLGGIVGLILGSGLFCGLSKYRDHRIRDSNDKKQKKSAMTMHRSPSEVRLISESEAF